jgi:hypothetical protein
MMGVISGDKMSTRKMKSGGVMIDADLDKTKRYKYDNTGSLVESVGTVGVNEIEISGSKSNLRRMAEVERNISILATQLTTTDAGTAINLTGPTGPTGPAAATYSLVNGVLTITTI